MGPEGFWPRSTIEIVDQTPADAGAGRAAAEGAAADTANLVLRVREKNSGRLLQEVSLAKVKKVRVHRIDSLQIGRIYKPGWTHILVSTADAAAAGLYFNGKTQLGRAFLRALGGLPITVEEATSQNIFFCAAREARLPIGPPGETEFKAGKVQFGQALRYSGARAGGTGLQREYVGAALPPNAPGRDDTAHFDFRRKEGRPAAAAAAASATAATAAAAAVARI